jgi:NAD(P)-dependent dehydrogenase (short-subunit alcohol dehydrogenase family)
MGALDGRVVIITGGGQGIGREHALFFAGEGASVVVNDLGTNPDGAGEDQGPAERVASEIRDLGGAAVANTDDVADWDGGKSLIDQSIEVFGRLDVLVNNAGILRDRLLVNMTEQEWDSVIRVNLKGHFVPLHFAAAYWRERSKAGDHVSASVINTSSTSGLHSNAGQSNYGAAKSGVATLTEIAAKELARYGVRVNAIAPGARTRLTLQTPGLEDRMAIPAESDAFDSWDPANVSPLVGWLATQSCKVTGRVFFVRGGHVSAYRPWTVEHEIDRDSKWTIEELSREMKTLVEEA